MFDPKDKTAILIIGDEILSGKTQDTNSGWLAAQLGHLGLPVGEFRTVSDDQSEIADALNALRRKYKYVFTTGGIGPTHDDITADAVAAAFGVPINIHPEARAKLADYMGEENLNEARLRMARIPDGAILINNTVSAAPGFQLDNVLVMAGVPHIMKAMFDGHKHHLAGGPPILAKAIATRLKEGAIAAPLGELQDKFPATSIGSYPTYRDGDNVTKLVVRGIDATLIEQVIGGIRQMIIDIGDHPIDMDV